VQIARWVESRGGKGNISFGDDNKKGNGIVAD
jgi:hypothetical protein